MAVDGPYDGEVADDAVHVHAPADRARRDDLDGSHGGADSGVDTISGPLDREAYYNGLRSREQSEPHGWTDRAETTDDGGWRWKGLELDPAANRIADQALAARREAEGRDDAGNYGEVGITPAMRRIEAELEHGTLVPDTERFALKSPDRFKEKLAKLIERYPDHQIADLAGQISDGIRYTFIFDGARYADGVAQVNDRLEAEGFTLERQKPSWESLDYRGVNCRWSNAHGTNFEVQFHTAESWEAKQKTHDIYERLSDAQITPLERAQLEREQESVVRRVLVPPGALEITYYVRGSGDSWMKRLPIMRLR